LLLVSDVDGVRVAGAAIPAVECGDVEALVASGEATGGMIPKLRAAARAVECGVGEVRIGGFGGGSLLDLSGTRVLPAGSRAPEVRA
jgi:acetylglutamate kinase